MALVNLMTALLWRACHRPGELNIYDIDYVTKEADTCHCRSFHNSVGNDRVRCHVL